MQPPISFRTPRSALHILLLGLPVLLPSILILQPSASFAQGTAFTYQGRLDDGAGPANGIYDLQFTIFDSSGGAGVIAGPITNSPVAVSNGLFTATLDFGAGAFPGDHRWLEIAVRTNGGGTFTALSPRQALASTPYAIRAARFSGVIASDQLSGTYGNAVSLNHPANSFAGSGTGLTDLNASQLTSGMVPDARLSTDIARLNQVWQLGGNTGTAAGTHFLGTTDNQPLEFKVKGLRALRFEENGDGPDAGDVPDGAPNIIGGSPANEVGAGVVGATISGGGATNAFLDPAPNVVLAHYGTVGGGIQNRIGAGSYAALIAGGRANLIGDYAGQGTIGGGYNNQLATNSVQATIAGGSGNSIGTNGAYGSIGGGVANTIANDSASATIAGGGWNDIGANSTNSVIGGGYDNNIGGQSPSATIAGGRLHDIGTNSPHSSIGGGDQNLIGGNAAYSTIAGGRENNIASNSWSTTVAGGYLNDIGTDVFAGAVGGGSGNKIAGAAHFTTIAGGQINDIGADADFGAIGGGFDNNIASSAAYATIAGGRQNDIAGNAFHSTVSGGYDNNIVANAESATISGGTVNSIGSSSSYSVVGGGQNNHIAGDSFAAAIAGGGSGNIRANSDYSVVGGGFDNSTTINAQYGTIPGGRGNSVTNYAFAAGRRAKADHQGAFVWADAQDVDFASLRANQFRVRADGGARFDFNESHWVDLRYGLSFETGFFIINTSSGAYLTAGGTWSNASDRERKTGFTAVDPQVVLAKVAALPLSEWSYKAEGGTIRHLGPVAQDFHAAFGLGASDKAIATVDADGVALAAIQGLNEKFEVRSQKSEDRSRILEERLEQREKEITELKQRLAALERLIFNQPAN